MHFYTAASPVALGVESLDFSSMAWLREEKFTQASVEAQTESWIPRMIKKQLDPLCPNLQGLHEWTAESLTETAAF